MQFLVSFFGFCTRIALLRFQHFCFVTIYSCLLESARTYSVKQIELNSKGISKTYHFFCNIICHGCCACTLFVVLLNDNILYYSSFQSYSLSRIASSSFSLPSSLSLFARDLITRLIKGQFYNSSHVKTHPFFTGVNWKMVRQMMIQNDKFYIIYTVNQ